MEKDNKKKRIIKLGKKIGRGFRLVYGDVTALSSEKRKTVFRIAFYVYVGIGLISVLLQWLLVPRTYSNLIVEFIAIHALLLIGTTCLMTLPSSWYELQKKEYKYKEESKALAQLCGYWPLLVCIFMVIYQFINNDT